MCRAIVGEGVSHDLGSFSQTNENIIATLESCILNENTRTLSAGSRLFERSMHLSEMAENGLGN